MASSTPKPAPTTTSFYRRVIRTLKGEGVPFLAGGAHALKTFTGIGRTDKDLDLFVRPADVDRTLNTLSRDRCQAEVRFPHWLAKVHAPEGDVDIIFRAENGLLEVDDSWFEHAGTDEYFGISVPICAPEEMIASKAFVMERERYDGSDVAHLFYRCAEDLDWDRLLTIFGQYWRILLSHLILFGFIYPSESGRIPGWVMNELLQRLQAEKQNSEERLCQGTLLSRTQYAVDVQQWGLKDARLQPLGKLTRRQVQMLEEDAKDDEQS